MSSHRASIHWQRRDTPFTNGQYTRKHRWIFDSGFELPATASPKIVPPAFTEPQALDPEEAFVASLSSCHMLWFLSIASNHGYVVDEYRDVAEGIMKRNPGGKLAITEVILSPTVTFQQKPDTGTFDKLHQQAHQKCFIANSVKTNVSIKARMNES